MSFIPKKELHIIQSTLDDDGWWFDEQKCASLQEAREEIGAWLANQPVEFKFRIIKVEEVYDRA